MSVRIAPSVLAADIAYLADEVARAEAGGCDAFHLDIMDGHFVPNLSFGPAMAKTLRRLTNLPLDVHLMVDNPRDMIGPFIDAGSDYLTIHVEVAADTDALIADIAGRGVVPGLSLKPDTSVEALEPYLADVGLVLVMSVYPGFGGQAFIEDSYGRIRALSESARAVNPSLILSVDGGVTMDNAPKLVDAGANFLVAGTALFRDHRAEENVRTMRSRLDGR